MQHTELLHNILEKSGAIKHKRRLMSLMSATDSVMNGANLDLTSLGRYMNREIKPKSKIKGIDYLLSNGHILRERINIYRAINEWMIGNEKVLYVVVDWSSIVAHEQHVLRASLIRKGRAVTVYEEIFPEKELSKAESHLTFLNNLKLALPQDREICIVVDAGFRTDFFIQVQTNDWSYVARILSNMKYLPKDSSEWQEFPYLYEQATSEPQAVGEVKLAKSNKVEANLYLYKKIKKVKLNGTPKPRKVKHGRKEKDYSNAAKKPWLIASSLKISAKKIMKIYKARMKIEHDFRDSKDPKWGFGLRRSRSVDPLRLLIQLLIGFLASVMLWLIGLCLENKNLHRDFQANSIKHKRVLSLVFLALEAIRSGYMKYIHKNDYEIMRNIGLYDKDLPVQFL